MDHKLKLYFLIYVFAVHLLCSRCSDSNIFKEVKGEELESQIKALLDSNLEDFLYAHCELKKGVECSTRVKFEITGNRFCNRYISDSDNCAMFNTLLAKCYYYRGEYLFYGMKKSSPDLARGLEHFIIAGYFGNSDAQQKLYFLIETMLIDEIIYSKEFQLLLENNPLLSFISKTPFYNNFQYKEDYEKNNIELLLLYASAVSGNLNAQSILGYKYKMGFGVKQSCAAAINYYKANAENTIVSIFKRGMPNYYQKSLLEKEEYILFKFDSNYHIKELVEYLKVEANSGNIEYIQTLANRYLFGQGIDQNLEEAFKYYQLGANYLDPQSIYYLGLCYLKGYGIDKAFT